MRKAGILLLFVVFLSASGSAQLDSTIEKDSCPSGYEPVISMPNPDATYSNPAPASIYDYKVCVTGITEARYGDACRNAPAFYLSSNTTHAHFSKMEGYNMRVCTGKMTTRIRDQCDTNEVPLFSVSDRINGFGRHVAGFDDRNPDVFSNIVCGYYRPPGNVTLSLNFNLSGSDEVYFDDEQRDSEFNYSGMVEFPYIISTSGSYTAGIVSTSFRAVERKLQNENILEMTKDADSPSFFLPFVENDHQTIENSQSRFLEAEFMNQLDPSFSFEPSRETVVRAMVDTDTEIKSDISITQGTFQVKIEKTGENQVTIQTE